jgi:hypothetical protein
MLLNSSVKHICLFIVWLYFVNVVEERKTPVIAEHKCSQNMVV